MITSLLIANRGEIACRIIRTCRRLGIRAVAVYSVADAHALHVDLADEAIQLGPAPARDSYLDIAKIIAAARRAGVDAIHPGYGFLAENAHLAAACATAGLIFIGPAPAAIAAMGNKRAARDLVARAGVPVVPGYGGEDQTDAVLRREAERLGWPVMVKAAAGGGGKGMRLVRDPAALAEALDSARREARQAFGSDELIMERAIERPRHIEFQVFGDQHGGLIHLGERECSIQRRHQKVIEESPAPGLTSDQRAAIGAAAVAAARAVAYTGAGTVEFLLDRAGGFAFLEMNTRLQVEHPVSESVTGLDLVEWQIRIAEGEPLPLRQEEVRFDGHAIEARLYAEDPANQYLPATGTIALWRPPAGTGVRVDGGIRTGDQVSIYYDPLLAKIIAHGPDRATACRRLARALETTALLGVANNRSFLRAILDQPAFQAGDLSTAFLDEHLAGWTGSGGDLALALIAAALAQWTAHPQPETNRGYWRNNPNSPQRYRFATPHDGTIEVSLLPERQPGTYRVTIAPDFVVTVELNALDGPDLTLTIDGHRQRVALARAGDTWWVQGRAGAVRLREIPLLPVPRTPAGAGGSLRAPMPGSVLAVLVEVGQRVARGDALLKLEAMKMEHTIRTAADGVVAAIYFAPGDTVEADALLIEIRD